MPALALGVEPVEHDIMKRRPRRKNESIFSGGVGTSVVWQGMMIGALTLTAYYIGSRTAITGAGPELSATMAFAVLAMSQLVHALNIRSSRSLFRAGAGGNKYMVWAFCASLLLMLAVLTIPQLRFVFGASPLGAAAWFAVAGLSLAPLLLCETVKLFGAGAVKNGG